MDTNTNIQDEVKYVSAFKRSSALSIDMIIVMFFRIVAAQLLGSLWINNVIQEFILDFRENFGTETISNTPEHIAFIGAHPAFTQLLLFYFIIISIGLLYHSYLNSSTWQATIGKRLLDIQVVQKENHQKIKFGTAISHYLLSILPIIFIVYLFAAMIHNHVTLFQAITSTPLNVFIGFSAIFWVQIHTFTKNKTTAYDMICKLVYIHGKSKAKLPWSKV